MASRETHDAKLSAILACPSCGGGLDVGNASVHCRECSSDFAIVGGTPLLVTEESPVRVWFRPASGGVPLRTGWASRLRDWIQRPDRVWTRGSETAIARVLSEKNPDAGENTVLLIGAGFEPVFRRLLKPFHDCLRIGLEGRGRVDAFGDVCQLPVGDESLDAVLSSSVLEHVYDPERAVSNMARVLAPGGLVYAEVPFLRAYHMEPIDYQRYTFAGIRELFERHGFTTEEVGICSGPFTALVLYLRDLASSLFYRTRYPRAIAELVVGTLLHPLKYLDRWCESSEGARVTACNFYYLGRRG